MKIVIYGMGQIFYMHEWNIDWNSVVAIVDKKQKVGNYYREVPIITPKNLVELEYDYIAVFTSKFFNDIRTELTAVCFVDESKIISFRDVVNERKRVHMHIWNFMKMFIEEKKSRKILDVGLGIAACSFLNLEKIFNRVIQIDGIGNEIYPIYNNLYNRVYIGNEYNNEKYDAVLIWNVEQNVKSFTKYVREMGGLLFYTPYLDKNGLAYSKIVPQEFNEGYFVRKYAQHFGIIWEIRKKQVERKDDISIYVVTHKRYNVKNDDMYCPICVGEKYQNDMYLSEKQGDNISHLNEKINECTALYWIWRNTSSGYVGLNHYRRYFYNNGIQNDGNYLEKNRALGILKEYDIILTDELYIGDQTCLDQMKSTIEKNAFEQGYRAIRRAIEKNQPDYMEAFNYVMNGHVLYTCNMFVTKREILNSYCEWLFSFLLEAAEAIDVSMYDDYSKRVIGFFAERMLTVWLMNQELKIKELPYSIV